MEARNEVMHGGTYTANLVALAAADATLEKLDTERAEIYERLNTFGERLTTGIGDACREAGLRNISQGVGPLWNIFFAKPDAPDIDRIRNYRDALAYASVDLFDRFHDQMLARGVYFHPYHLERWFLSAVHDEEDVNRTLEAAYDSAEAIAKG